MRANPAEYEIVAPGGLPAVLSLMATDPGQWLPIAGGTDVMVLYAAGKLSQKKLVSLWGLRELRFIEVSDREVRIGAACTYTDLRRHPLVRNEFPLLAAAASWTGGIANQNRGTLGGNIANASPAADSLPALLVYDAELVLASVRGDRRVAYSAFHNGYKKMDLAPDELIRTICLQRKFSGYCCYARKVGARNAQAIAKVCIAALGKIREGVIADARIAIGSVAPVPMRIEKTELVLIGRKIEPALLKSARESLANEIRPIDDIRSNAAYRTAVAQNLLCEFLEKLAKSEETQGTVRSDILSRWNELPGERAAQEILPCCGSRTWAARMAALRPFSDDAAFFAAADESWRSLIYADVDEAFRSHPRIGESKSASTPQAHEKRSAAWSEQEQRNVSNATEDVKLALAQGNRQYEKRFGRIFILCATGKSPDEILRILRLRLQNNDEKEFREASEQQRHIMQLRLRKWLAK